MTMLTERRVTSLVLLLIGAALLSQTFGQAYSGLGAFSPMFFPKIILLFWVGIALLDLIAELRAHNTVAQARLLRVGIIALASVAFLIAMTRIGFFLSAVPFALVALVTLGLHRPLPMVAVAIGIPAALVVLFNHVLTLPLPTSPFTWWF